MAVFSFRNQPFRVLVQYSVIAQPAQRNPPEQWRNGKPTISRFCRIGSLSEKADIPFLVRLKTRFVKRLRKKPSFIRSMESIWGPVHFGDPGQGTHAGMDGGNCHPQWPYSLNPATVSLGTAKLTIRAASTINILLLTINAFHNNMVVLITTENEIDFLQDTEKYRSAGSCAVS